MNRLRGVATADDLVNRKFHRLRPNELRDASLCAAFTASAGRAYESVGYDRSRWPGSSPLPFERMPAFAQYERRLDGVPTMPVVALKRVK